ncbi:DUF4143 domain-containing protein [Nesterenkonia salmonea]|uniref:DUF4143 domain-containing protein n=1 Tax=Nesterenkonia salmonea TaxID=1804987 RepID=UPI003C7D4BE0
MRRRVAERAGTSPDSLYGDADLRGRLLDSFVLAQLRPLAELNDRTVTTSHFRDTNGHREVDLLLESCFTPVTMRDRSLTGYGFSRSPRSGPKQTV